MTTTDQAYAAEVGKEIQLRTNEIQQLVERVSATHDDVPRATPDTP